MSQTPPDHEEPSTATVLALKFAMRSDDGSTEGQRVEFLSKVEGP
jgi:hypothetical protein